MAAVDRVNGEAAAMNQVGKTMIWVQKGSVTDLDAEVRAVGQVATIMIIGTLDSGNITMGIEGSVPAGYTEVEIVGDAFA